MILILVEKKLRSGMKIEIISEKRTKTNDLNYALSVLAFSKYPLTVKIESDDTHAEKSFDSFDEAKDFVTSHTA